MINGISKTDSAYKTNNTSFKAIPLARYRYLQEKGDVIIYQLEKKDIDYLRFLRANLGKLFEKHKIHDESTEQVMREAFEAGIKILEGEKKEEEKAKILMSFYKNEPSSIIIGNVLKVDGKGQLHYSSRKNHAKNETELDWLVTWNDKIPGEGVATVYEYFMTVIKDGFKQVFVRSEIPEKSSAQKFYEKMGFELLSDKPRLIQRKEDNEYLIGQADDLGDMILPMKATIADIINVIKKKKDEVLRKEIKSQTSVNLEKVI